MGWGRGVLLVAEPRGEQPLHIPITPVSCLVTHSKHLPQLLSKAIISNLFSPSTILKDHFHKENSSPSPLRLSRLSCQQHKATGTSCCPGQPNTLC